MKTFSRVVRQEKRFDEVRSLNVNNINFELADFDFQLATADSKKYCNTMGNFLLTRHNMRYT